MKALPRLIPMLSPLALTLLLPTGAAARNVDPAQPHLWDSYLAEKGKTLYLHRDNCNIRNWDFLRWIPGEEGVGTWEVTDTSERDHTSFRTQHPILVSPVTGYRISFTLAVEDMTMPPPTLVIEERDYNRDRINANTIPLISPTDRGTVGERTVDFVTSSETHTLMVEVNTTNPGTARFSITDLHVEQTSEPRAHSGPLTRLLDVGPVGVGNTGDHDINFDEYADHNFYLEGFFSAASLEARLAVDLSWKDANGTVLRKDTMTFEPETAVTGDFAGVANQYLLPLVEGEKPLSAYFMLHRTDVAGIVDDRFLIEVRPPAQASRAVMSLPEELATSSLSLRNIAFVAEERVPISPVEMKGAGLSTISPADSDGASNLVSFEGGTGGPRGWQLGGTREATPSDHWHSNGPEEDSRHISLVGEGAGEYMQWYTDGGIPVQAGAVYYLQFKYSFSDLGGERRFYARVLFFDADGEPLDSGMVWDFPSSGSIRDWRETVLSDRAPDGAVRARVLFSSNPGAQGRVFIGDVRFFEAGESSE